MGCRFCNSPDLRVFTAEMNIHFPAPEGIDKPTVWVFPPVTICLHCGCAEFAVHDEALKQLRDNSTESKAS